MTKPILKYIIKSGTGYLVGFMSKVPPTVITPEMTTDPLEASRTTAEGATSAVKMLQELGYEAELVELVIVPIG